MRVIIFIITIYSSSAVLADEVFKCSIDGKISYQGQPCPETQKEERIKVEVVGGSEDPIMSHKDRLNRAALLSKVMIGMSPMQVRRAWGQPASINKSFVAGSAREQWVFNWSPGNSHMFILKVA
jgi:hypothetical protein